MSIIFGIVNLDGAPVEHATLLCLAQRTEAYAPDGSFIQINGKVGMGFQPYHTTVLSRLDVQPWSDLHKNILVFDGRLDNHGELAHLLSLASERSTDSSLVLSAFERWGEACFERLVGDWSLALWSAGQRKLYLARDHAGTRTLYYQLRGSRVVWSTYLETFLGPNETQTLDEEFAARYLGGLPIRTSTPYAGIRAVPPAHALIFEKSTVRSSTHWSWMVAEKLVYKDAQEYDDQFMECFERSVQRRDIPGAPILAELSGGMDSTAIVCISDALRRRENQQGALLDTVSLYDNSESDWDELPYITATERYRGKKGVHIATSYLNRSFSLEEQEKVVLFPGNDSRALLREQEFEAHIASDEYRVIFSGIGGDELLGGVPTPYPELADHLASLRLQTASGRITAWCLSNRDAFFPTSVRTIRFVFDLYLHPLFDVNTLTPWVSPCIRRLCVELAHEEENRYPRIRYLPSGISNGRNWLSVLETLPHLYPKSTTRREYRYPYLDRDLVDYLLRVPREQLLQPGRRRAMMRRALKPFMPQEVVERRRKAYMSRGPLALLQKERTSIERLLSTSRLEAYGYLDMSSLRSLLHAATSGSGTEHGMALLRLLAFEFWLQTRDGHVSLGRIPGRQAKRSTRNIEANSIPMVQVER
jgi:asparagine synthase (glutamine-hydrolysing)